MKVRRVQEALVSLAADGSLSQTQQSSLDEFLAQLPELRKRGEARPTPQPKRTRTYRTHPDPFEGDWTTSLEWLEKQPDASATSLLERLIAQSGERYNEKQLRSLQRRVGQWRYIMAKQLVFGTTSDQVSRLPRN